MKRKEKENNFRTIRFVKCRVFVRFLTSSNNLHTLIFLLLASEVAVDELKERHILLHSIMSQPPEHDRRAFSIAKMEESEANLPKGTYLHDQSCFGETASSHHVAAKKTRLFLEIGASSSHRDSERNNVSMMCSPSLPGPQYPKIG